MGAAEFDAYTRGKTFYYGSSGAPYGAEEYLDNNRVQWSFLDGKCKRGEWYAQNDLICFVYDDEQAGTTVGPDCWSFEITDNGMTARFEDGSGNQNPTELYEVEQSDEPMMCLGPEVGV